ncbi:MAG TPA: BON domain-containing protein [Blastocatellia bacterium]|nr:BON domain-containing protein [Blastocatellia bacterium]
MRKSLSIFIAVMAINLALVGCDVNRENTNTGRNGNTTTLTDSELENAVKAKFNADPDLKAVAIDVDADADHNEVTLSGKLGSQALRTRAVDLAKSAHSGLIVNDKIDVMPGEISRADYTEAQAREERNRAVKSGESVGDSLDDAWVHAKITTKLIGDPNTPQRKINVDVRDNIVTLRGTVDTAAERTEAEQVAKNTDGVRRVVNQLKVSPSSR